MQIKYIAFLILFVVILPVFTQGYGYDAGASCSTKSSRRGRAQLLSAIPCDITTQSYCNLPGTLYPWHAVRRFVHENQGLMKRMYGDVRHISVLRDEINNNDIGLDDVENTAARYSRSGWKRNKYLYQDNSRIKNNDILTEPHFRRVPTTTTTNRFRSTASTTASTATSTTAKTTTRKSTKAATSSASSTITSTTQKQKPTSESTVPETTEGATVKQKLQSNRRNTNVPNTTFFNNEPTAPNNPNESNTIEEVAAINGFRNATNTINNIKIVGAPNLTMNKTEAATISTTLRIIGFLKGEEETTTIPSIEEDNTQSITVDSDDFIANTTIEPLETNVSETNDANSETADSEVDESVRTEEVVDVNGNKVPNKISQPNENAGGGQLFQDVAQKDEPSFVVNSRGV